MLFRSNVKSNAIRFVGQLHTANQVETNCNGLEDRLVTELVTNQRETRWQLEFIPKHISSMPSNPHKTSNEFLLSNDEEVNCDDEVDQHEMEATAEKNGNLLLVAQYNRPKNVISQQRQQHQQITKNTTLSVTRRKQEFSSSNENNASVNADEVDHRVLCRTGTPSGQKILTLVTKVENENAISQQHTATKSPAATVKLRPLTRSGSRPNSASLGSARYPVDESRAEPRTVTDRRLTTVESTVVAARTRPLSMI